MKKINALIVATTAALFLAGCSISDTSTDPSNVASETTTATESSPATSAPANNAEDDPDNGLFPVDGKYEFTYFEGATGEFTFEGEADPEIESLRKAVNAEPVHYMNVKVDNRQGSDHAPVYQVVGYDTAGKKYVYTGINQILDEWQEEVSDDDPGLSNRFSEEYNKYLDSVDRSEVGFQLLAFKGELPEGFTRVEVQPSGMGAGVDAYLEGQEPPSTEELPPFIDVDDCLQYLAEINAEVDGGTVESYLDEPILKEACEDLVNGVYEDGNQPT